MSVIIKVFNSLNEVDINAYCLLKEQAGGSIFYDIRFLKATEEAHLLPIEKVFYFVAYKGEEMLAFMPCYLQPSADPFGVLTKTNGIHFNPNTSGLFNHIMHCYESTILVKNHSRQLYQLMLKHLKDFAQQNGIKYYGILNTIDKELLTTAHNLGLKGDYMWDRFYIDFSTSAKFEAFLMQLNREGRQLFRRQLRKYENSGGYCEFEAPPFTKIEEIVELCHLTTKKHGTAHYYPQESFKKFIMICGQLIRILSIYFNGRRVAVGVCFLEKHKLHLWACGMVYDEVPFSPYVIAIAEAFQYALKNNIPIVEIGRTNGKMKQKLGFSPLPLYSIVNQIGD